MMNNNSMEYQHIEHYWKPIISYNLGVRKNLYQYSSEMLLLSSMFESALVKFCQIVVARYFPWFLLSEVWLCLRNYTLEHPDPVSDDVLIFLAKNLFVWYILRLVRLCYRCLNNNCYLSVSKTTVPFLQLRNFVLT